MAQYYKCFSRYEANCKKNLLLMTACLLEFNNVYNFQFMQNVGKEKEK
jgi:hypothetical protein